MNQLLGSHQTPEERELAKKCADLAVLEAELAQQELDVATLEAELRTFEARYFRIIGRLYAELDDLQAQRAEARARRHPQNADLLRQATDARARASESAEAVGAALLKEGDLRDFAPPDELKRLYREIAKQVHPDLTTDERERARRTRLMAEANRAYAAGDEATLRAILDEWVSSPESVPGEGVAAELVRTIRKIHQVERRLANIANEMAALKQSELFTLWQRAEAAKAQHRDLLAEMAEELKRQIAAARAELTTLSPGKAERERVFRWHERQDN
jgi:hypothetical protein